MIDRARQDSGGRTRVIQTGIATDRHSAKSLCEGVVPGVWNINMRVSVRVLL